MFDRGILEALLTAKDTGFPIVLATIIKDSGSVPRFHAMLAQEWLYILTGLSSGLLAAARWKAG
jgi:hypothetical protein